MEKYADIVKIHYEYYKSKQKPRLRGSPQKQLDTSYKKHIPSNLNEIEKYSDIDSMVFENNNNNELVIAMRGLNIIAPRDAMIGAEIALEDAYQQGGSDFESSTKKKKGVSLFKNQYGEILIKEQSKIKELKQEYPNKKIVLAGHSRGGRKAIDLGEHNDLEYHAFQPAEMNKVATPFLTMGTNMLLGTIVPTDKIYKELVKSYMDRDAFEQGNRMGRTINNLFIEGYSPIEIQDKVIGSTIQANSYQQSLGKLTERIIMPQIVKRTVADPQLMFNEPADFTQIISDELLDAQEQIEFGYKIASLPKQDKRQVSSKNSNIYKTKNDRVSRGYQHTELVQPKQYAYDMFDHYLLGSHSIDHFVSKEMFDSVSQNKPIEAKSDSSEPIISPQPSPQQDIQPSSSMRYNVDNVSLCRKYPNYSPQCKKILR